MDNPQTDDGQDDGGQFPSVDQDQDDAQLAQYINQANDQMLASLPGPATPGATYLQGGGPDQSGLSSTYYGNAADGPLAPSLAAAFDKIPGQAKQDINDFGTRLDVVPHSVADVEGRDGPTGDPPPGYPKGSHWTVVAGAYVPGDNTLVFSTDGEVGTGSNDLAMHEIGHAHDRALGTKLGVAPDDYGVQYASNSPDFQAAYEADKVQLQKDDERLNTHYYVEPDDPENQLSPEGGRNESYAESFANYYNGTPGWSDAHPNLQQWFESLDNTGE